LPLGKSALAAVQTRSGKYNSRWQEPPDWQG